MNKKVTRYHISDKPIDCIFNAAVNDLLKYATAEEIVIITDDVVNSLHEEKLNGFKTIVIPSGEKNKRQFNVDIIIEKLIHWQINKNHLIVGVGGGVITDIAGYVAAIYKRGTRLGLIPTTLLGMVDAALGGKNGVNHGVHKNMIGTIYQPDCILFDYSFLNSLPDQEWQNGFAEIIKHACIKDAAMFKLLQANSLKYYQSKKKELITLIERNAKIKLKVVQADEFEKAERKLLNFGHTLGHALENLYELSHGQAISIGMNYASEISEQLLGFKQNDAVNSLLQQYGLPTNVSYNKRKVFEILKMDKKKAASEINYILLEKIGKAIMLPIPLADLENLL
jgi:3-dehydroquinate synthase